MEYDRLVSINMKPSTQHENSQSTSPVNKRSVKISVFSCKPYDIKYLTKANEKYGFILDFHSESLNTNTAVLAKDCEVVSAFVNDIVCAECLAELRKGGTRFLALRCAGVDSVDLVAANELDIVVANVPSYSPFAVAEHAIALLLTLNRNTHKAYNRVRDHNFALDGLIGFDMHGKTVGIIGTGKIGAITGNILKGFGCTIVCYDICPSKDCISNGFEYVTLSQLYHRSDIISLHASLNSETYHMINKAAIDEMKKGVVIINTSRGSLIDTNAIIDGLTSRKISKLGIDVYENEQPIFYEDLSDSIVHDECFQRLQSFNNVLITAHQAFFTHEALVNIANSTLSNINDYATGRLCDNVVDAQKVGNRSN